MDALDKIRMAGGVEKPSKKVRTSERRKQLLTRHDPVVVKQLKQIAVEKDTDVQALMEEAINMLFLKYQRQPIA